MVTEQQKKIIKDTAPYLVEHGDAVATAMYKRMFSKDPMVKAYFNPVHQISGRQPRALASAICAYAMYIDDPGQISDAVELIAQKHCSLNIRPELYPIVGRNLLAAIQEVLGDVATDEVIDAWSAAYGMLADIFIKREAEIFRDHIENDGWVGFKPFIVSHTEYVSDNIRSVYLKPRDGMPLSEHKPGQYIALYAELPNGNAALRNYSLSNPPGTPYFRISIKREDAPDEVAPNGKFSHFAHHELKEGEEVQISPPCGEFTYQTRDTGKPLVFIAGGVGITPLLSMLHKALADDANANRPIHFIQAVRNEKLRPFVTELDDLARNHGNLHLHVRYSEPADGDLNNDRMATSKGFIDEDLLQQMVGNDKAEYYFCGPEPMLAQVYKLLRDRNVASQDISFEFFGPAQDIENAA